MWQLSIMTRFGLSSFVPVSTYLCPHCLLLAVSVFTPLLIPFTGLTPDCGDVSPSPCHSLSHSFSPLNSVSSLSSSFLTFIFQTLFSLFCLLTFFFFIIDPPYVSLCYLKCEWQKYFGRLCSLVCLLYKLLQGKYKIALMSLTTLFWERALDKILNPCFVLHSRGICILWSDYRYYMLVCLRHA